MEVKEASANYLRTTGYKQTEVGMIPEDWDVPELGDILKSMQLGGNYKNSERETNWPLIKMGNLQRGNIKLDKLEFIDSSQLPTNRDRLVEDDVLFNTRNTLELVGKVAIWRNELPEAYFNSNIMRMVFDEERVSSRRFMNYILNTSRSLRSLRGIATGTTSVAAIYSRDLVKVKVPLPTRAEQEAIAEALSDADALIESLERLLAKKRHLKQGAMQQLLTGKKRLPGFSGEWQVKTFNEVCWFQEGPGVRNTQFTTSGVKLLNGTNIFRGVLNLDSTSRFISEREAYDAYSHFLADSGDIVIASSGITIERFHEKVAYVRACDLPFCMNTSTIRFKPFAGVLASDFLFQYLTSDSFKRAIGGQATGSAQLNFGPSHVAKVSISLPECSEQTAIATILSDMDAELAALEAKLAKARHLKQGMMQELLTGRIRLV